MSNIDPSLLNEEELKRILLTSDGKGVKIKTLVLEELIARIGEKEWMNGFNSGTNRYMDESIDVW